VVFGGESADQVFERFEKVVEREVEAAGAGKDVVLVSHATILSVFKKESWRRGIRTMEEYGNSMGCCAGRGERGGY
jgi:broad specificity phosphatase PhoE